MWWKSTTPKGVASSLTSLPRVGYVTLANPALSKVQPRCGRGTPRGLVDIGRGGACVPARVAPQGRPSLNSPRKMHVFLIWKRRYADVRAGTQAPPLRFRLGGCVWMVLFVGKAVHMNQHHRCCTFVSPGLPTIGGYPG